MMPALMNRARSVFFEDSSAMKWLNQMLEEPGHLTVHFSELLEAMPEVTGTPVPGNLASCFVPGKARRPALQGRALPPFVVGRIRVSGFAVMVADRGAVHTERRG